VGPLGRRFSLPALAVERPVTVAMFFTALSLLGLLSFRMVPVQLMPDYLSPVLFVEGVLPGADPEEVERELVIPLEGEVSRVAGVEEVSSTALVGRGSLQVKIHPDRDLEMAFLELQGRIQAASARLPRGAQVFTSLFDTGQFADFVMQFSLLGDAEPDVLRRIAEQRVAPRLEAVQGVVKAWVVGGQGLSVAVEIDPDRAAARGISPFAVRNAIIQANRRRLYMGHVREGDSRLFITLEGGLESPHELAQMQVAPGPVLLRDVADVRLGLLLDERRFRIDGLSTVSVNIMKDQTANLLAVGNRVAEALEDLEKDLAAEGLSITVNFDASEMVRDNIRRLVKLALIGAGLALIVLLLFLKDLRALIIIMIAIPVSVLVAGVGIWSAGLSVNILTLMGMALAVGMLVDNAIVSLEAIERYRALGLPVRQAATVGGTEVQRALLAATATTAVVFLPLAWFGGEMRSLWVDFALSVMLPLTASLLVALLLVPMLAANLLSGRLPSWTLDPATLGGAWYRAVLAWTARNPIWAFIGFYLFLLVSMILTLPFILTSMVGQRAPLDRIEMALEMPTGTTIEETDGLARELETLLGEVEGVERVETVVEDEVAYFTTALFGQDEEEARDPAAVRKDVDEQTRKIPRSRGRVVMDRSLRASPSGGGGDEQDPLGLSGSRERVVIRGADPDVLAHVARQIQELVEQLDEVADRSFQFTFHRNRGEELRILPDRTALALHGLSVQDLMQVVWATRREVEKLDVPLRWYGEDIDISIGITGGDERALADLKRVRVPTPGGGAVDLTDVARARIDLGPRRIERKNRGRETDLTFRFREDRIQTNEALETARKGVEDALGSVHMPPGVSARLEREDPTSELKKALYVGLFLMFLVLAVTFESLVLPLVVILALPLAMAGVLWSLALTGSSLEPTVILAIIMLAGLVVNGSILLVDRAQALLRERGFPPLRAAMQASRDRTRPVIMTASTTVLGLLPMALKTGAENEIWPPFAITVIGGMSFATILTLIFAPAGFLVSRMMHRVWREVPWRFLTAMGLTALGLYLAYFPLGLVGSTLWRFVWPFFVIPAAVGLAWASAAGRRRRERLATAPRAAGYRVDLHNATKVYGEPGPFLRTLGARRLREVRRAGEGRPVWGRRNVAADLWWEAPLAGLFLWTHTWFTSYFWLFVLTWLTWAALRRLLRDLSVALGLTVRDPEGDSWTGLWAAAPMRVARTVLFAAAVLYAHARFDLHWVFTAIYVGLALAVRTILVIGKRLRMGQALPAADSWWQKLRRWTWRVVSKIPAVGRARERVPALLGVDLEVGNGMFGLLGPNGAGKTTLLRIVAGVLEPSRGMVRMEGLNVVTDRDLLQGRAGYLPQDSGLYDNMTARDYLHYHALLMGLEDPENRRGLVEEVLEAVGLAERAGEKVGSYSGGMRQRVGIARTLLALPEILVVDEPTVGLDPAERIRFRTFLARLARERTVLFSTHVVEDVATACDRLAVMDRGRICFLGTPGELRASAEGSVWEVLTDDEGAVRLRRETRVVHTQREVLEDGTTGMRVRTLGAERPAGDAVPVEPTLEDAYLLLVPPRSHGEGRTEVSGA